MLTKGALHACLKSAGVRAGEGDEAFDAATANASRGGRVQRAAAESMKNLLLSKATKDLADTTDGAALRKTSGPKKVFELDEGDISRHLPMYSAHASGPLHI